MMKILLRWRRIRVLTIHRMLTVSFVYMPFPFEFNVDCRTSNGLILRWHSVTMTKSMNCAVGSGIFPSIVLFPCSCHHNKCFRKRVKIDVVCSSGIYVCREFHQMIHKLYWGRNLNLHFNTLRLISADDHFKKYLS